MGRWSGVKGGGVDQGSRDGGRRAKRESNKHTWCRKEPGCPHSLPLSRRLGKGKRNNLATRQALAHASCSPTLAPHCPSFPTPRTSLPAPHPSYLAHAEGNSGTCPYSKKIRALLHFAR